MFKWKRTLGIGVLVAVTLFCASASFAAVTIKQSMTMTGLGGILDSETKMVTRVKGEMKADDTETKMTNKMMKFLGGGKPIKTTAIIRLDRDPSVMINVDHQSKTATESPLSEMREMMNQSAGMWSSQNSKDAPKSGPAYDTSEVTFSPPKITVDNTGKSEQIAGYDCKQSIITVEVEGTNRETGDTFTLVTVMDMFLAKSIPGTAEYEAFNQQFMAEMGFAPDNTTGNMKGMVGMMQAYGINPDDIADAAGKLDGYPMKSVITFRGDGEQFAQTADEQDAEASSDAMSKALGGIFGKKKDKESEEKAETPSGPPSIFTATLIVDEISTADVGDEYFNAPEKYKYKTPEENKKK